MNKEELITQNMGYVITLARQYQSDILSTEDLVSEGAIGMMKAQSQCGYVAFCVPSVRHHRRCQCQHQQYLRRMD